MSNLTDTSPMPFGVHAGKAMANVPANYLLWLWDNQRTNEEVKKYICENLQALQQEVRK